MRALIKKELGHVFHNPFGLASIALFGVFANFLFVKDVFVIGTISMRQLFTLIPWIAMVFVPAITMRILSEERRTNTIEVLRTLPLSAMQIVGAKFLALCVVCVVALSLTIGIAASMVFFASSTGSSLYIPEVIMGYVGVMGYLSVAIAVSLFFSSITSNQVAALLSSAVVLFVLNVVQSDFLQNVLPRFLQDTLAMMSPVSHMETIVKGVLDFRSLFFFVSVTIVWLWLTVIDVEKNN